jgi:hypothetical protein
MLAKIMHKLLFLSPGLGILKPIPRSRMKMNGSFPLPTNKQTKWQHWAEPFLNRVSFSAYQGITQHLWNPRVHYRADSAPSLDPILERLNPTHTLQWYFITPSKSDFKKPTKEERNAMSCIVNGPKRHDKHVCCTCTHKRTWKNVNVKVYTDTRSNDITPDQNKQEGH